MHLEDTHCRMPQLLGLPPDWIFFDVLDSQGWARAALLGACHLPAPVQDTLDLQDAQALLSHASTLAFSTKDHLEQIQDSSGTNQPLPAHRGHSSYVANPG